MADKQPAKKQAARDSTKYLAVVGIDSGGKRYEPGQPVSLPPEIRADYLARGKIRKAG